MLTTARGVSLGLGKIKLTDLNANLRDRAEFLKSRSESAEEQHKVVIKKHVDTKTLWAACRAVVFGTVIIIIGISMTILGYFDVDLSQELHMMGGDIEEMSINWVKRYLLKSLQYLGPIMMGIGSFILIIACVITLENRDKNTQVLHDLREAEPYAKKKSLLQAETIRRRTPMTNEEIREWTPRYKALPLKLSDSTSSLSRRRKFRSAPCIPQTLLDTIDTRKLYQRLLDTYYGGVSTEGHVVLAAYEHGRACTSTDEYCSHFSPTRQNVTVEVHNPPQTFLLSSITKSPSQRSPARSPQQQQSSPHLPRSSTASFRRTSDLAYIENSTSNITVTVDAVTINTTTTAGFDAQPPVPGYSEHPKESERRAPLASMDIEFRTSSSSSSANGNIPEAESFFAV